MFRKTKDDLFIRIMNFTHDHILVFVVIVMLLISGLSFLYLKTAAGKGNAAGPAASSETEEDSLTVYKDAGTIYLPMDRIRSLNPLVSVDKDTSNITPLVYSSLLLLGADLGVEGDLAGSWTIKDGRTVVLKLRKGLKFSNGDKLTAGDVRYTVSQIRKIGSKSPYYVYVSRIKEVRVSGDRKVIVEFRDPTQAALDNLTFPIVEEGNYNTSAKAVPVGSGPYVVKSFENGSLQLSPNKAWYGDVPKNKIRFKLIREKSAVTSMITTDALTASIEESADASLDASYKHLNCVPICSSEMEFLGFNFRNSDLAKRKVRRAIAYAVDTEALIRDNYGEYAVSSDSVFYPGFLGVENEGDPFRCNLSKAASLLRKAGYADADEDDLLENAKGKDLSFRMIVCETDRSRVDAAEDICTELKKLGISIDLSVMDEKSYRKAAADGKFDLIFGGFSFDKQYNLRVLFDKGNVLNYSNSAVKKRAADLERLVDREELVTAYSELKAELLKDLPYYCICYKQYAFVSSSTLEAEETPLFFDRYRGIGNWKWQRAYTPDTASDTYEK